MWQELRNEAANACFEYVQEAGLLGPLAGWESSLRIKTWVPETLRAQTAAYALQWHRSIPLKGIIIGQSPTPYDKGSPSSNETAPHLAASFAFKDGAEPPAASEILANEFRLCGTYLELYLPSSHRKSSRSRCMYTDLGTRILHEFSHTSVCINLAMLLRTSKARNCSRVSAFFFSFTIRRLHESISSCRFRPNRPHTHCHRS